MHTVHTSHYKIALVYAALHRDHSVKLEYTAVQMAALSNAPQDCSLLRWAELFNAAACTVLDAMSATLVPRNPSTLVPWHPGTLAP